MSLPLLFEENKGQFDEDVKFASRSKDFNVFLTSNEAIYQIFQPNCDLRNLQKSESCQIFSLTMKMFGANGDVFGKGFDQAVTQSNYYIGNDQNNWFENINNYRAVRYEQIYQGVDVVFRGVEQKLEYDFHVAPEADPECNSTRI